MPATQFTCPTGHKIKIKQCLKKCHYPERCATLPYLRTISHERKWTGKVSPSRAGTGPRKIYLEQVNDYAISPHGRAWASFGTATHDKLSYYKYTDNVLSEETLSDEDMKGIADVLEMDENCPGKFVLLDYKCVGSFKVAKMKGIISIDKEILDDEGNPILLKSGKNKGQPKTKKETVLDPKKADLRSETLQLNRYRIFFEEAGFPISRITIQVLVRDGNTYIAKSRGIESSIEMIDVPIRSNIEILTFYESLQHFVDRAFKTGQVRKCTSWESWEGRRCCEEYCEVYKPCMKMGKEEK
ncbi:MAG TPA: hypothetical protein ENH85_00330 [Candidatus Scalindua sp.]|nr:hypothetical protein [Candidatus Scalindua sp.]